MDFAAAGLGLQYGMVRLAIADPNWMLIGERLATKTKQALGELAADVQHIGSTAVPGLLAKPIIDLAIGVRVGVDIDNVITAMVDHGWIYRGDAQSEGGLVFVLEDMPRNRVAHAHGVGFGDEQWLRYLEFRELLRSDEAARLAYADTKERLAEQHDADAVAYTSGKTATVRRLIASDVSRAEGADLVAAVAVWRAANAARGLAPSDERIARVQQKLADPSSVVLVARRFGQVVGMVQAEPGRADDGAGSVLPDLGHSRAMRRHWAGTSRSCVISGRSEEANVHCQRACRPSLLARDRRGGMSDESGAWEPGMPSARAIGPSALGGAVIPLAVYFGIRHHVSGDATALVIAGIPAIAWILFQWIRTRQLDPIGAITLYGFAVGIIASIALDGNAYVLKVRETAFGIPFAIACLLSVRFANRPVMFHIGKAMSAGGDEERRAAYDALYELPTAPQTFRRITIVWGIAVLLHAGTILVIAAFVTTAQFLAIAPVYAAFLFGGLFVYTMKYSERARQEGEALLVELGLEYPSVPDAVSG